MPNPHTDRLRDWKERFDEQFPPFTGRGARFPMFKDTPVRTHIIQFIDREFSLLLEELRNELICNQAVHASNCSNIMVIPQSAVEKLLGTPTEDVSLAVDRIRARVIK